MFATQMQLLHLNIISLIKYNYINSTTTKTTTIDSNDNLHQKFVNCGREFQLDLIQ